MSVELNGVNGCLGNGIVVGAGWEMVLGNGATEELSLLRVFVSFGRVSGFLIDLPGSHSRTRWFPLKQRDSNGISWGLESLLVETCGPIFTRGRGI
jgi:hypothetical protein